MNSRSISYKTEVSINCLDCVHLCLVSAINPLGEGSIVSANIETEMVLNGKELCIMI